MAKLPDPDSEAELCDELRVAIQTVLERSEEPEATANRLTQQLVELTVRSLRFRHFDTLLFDCLEARRLHRLQARLRSQFDELLLSRAGAPDASGKLGQLEAKLEQKVGWFDLRSALSRIRQNHPSQELRLTELLTAITDDDIDRFEILLGHAPLNPPVA